MSNLGEQIAVLDGLDALDPNDGRLGQRRASVLHNARQVMPGVIRRRHVLDASEGANYSGGSSYAPGLPLLPSSVGLAGLGVIPSVLPTRRHVVDYSGGANYSGGSSYAPGMPLLPSSAGLAADFIGGGYGRAGLGVMNGEYGRAGLGSTGAAADEDLAGAAEAIATARALDPNDGRIGQRQAQVDEYGRVVMPGVLSRSNVLDPSEGANYSGGSSYAPGLPLLPSSVGLAGLEGLGAYDESDEVSDAALEGVWSRLAGRFSTRAAMRSAARKVVKKIGRVALTKNMKLAIKNYSRAKTARTPAQRAYYLRRATQYGYNLATIKAARVRIFQAARAVRAVRRPVRAW